jgi:aryl-phospho-beta-D-glucosidase BglC (GH1 family)
LFSNLGSHLLSLRSKCHFIVSALNEPSSASKKTFHLSYPPSEKIKRSFHRWANGGGVVDEYTFTQAVGPAQAENILTQHWATWITQDDFNEIASFGLNHVRIPIGYWALNPLPGDPYVQVHRLLFLSSH